MFQKTLLAFALAIALIVTSYSGYAKEVKILNVSYDPTRELYSSINSVFSKKWQEKTGDTLVLAQSHGGSGKQARAVIDGLEADVVTLALAYDIDALVKEAKLLGENWQSKLPGNSSPYISTIVFLVKKGNPKNIKNWDDLVKSGVSVITPNPKTSGGARWNYLAAWGFAFKKNNGDEAKAKEFVTALYKNVPVLDSGARGSTTTFVERGLGDVLLAWENEALLITTGIGKDKFEIVTPPLSILAEPPVAVVEKNAEKHGAVELAKAYLEFLYTDEAQEIIAKNFYRPFNKTILEKYSVLFPKIEFLKIDDDIFGGWAKAQVKHFADGALFDEIYTQK